MIKALRNRSETLFAVMFIAVYVIGNSLFNRASESLGIEMVLTLPFNLLLIAVMLLFIVRNGLKEYYRLQKPQIPAAGMLYFIPLLPVVTVNIWFGIVPNKGLAEGLVYFFAMIAAGIAEELIFRGFLFRAMSRKSLSSAVIFTSVLFGIGHIVNLFNGSGMKFTEGICQVFYAVSIGFLLAAVLVRGESLYPCMVTHAAFNALSLFANEPMHEKYQIPVAVSLCVISLAAAVYYLKSARGGK